MALQDGPTPCLEGFPPKSRSLAFCRASLVVSALLISVVVSTYAGTFTAFGPKTYVRGTGEPVTITEEFTVLNPNTSYTLRVTNNRTQTREDRDGEDQGRRGDDYKDTNKDGDKGKDQEDKDRDRDRDAGGVSRGIITINGVRLVGPDDFTDIVSVLNVPIKLLAVNQIAIEVLGESGGAITVQIIGVDTDLPTIKATVSPAPNAAGWNNTSVTVSFTCSDATSGVATCPLPQTVTIEGANQVIQGTAVDNAGNTATTNITLNIDKTPPTITASAFPAPNASGWNNSNVTVTFACVDSLSGVASCPSPITVSTEGSNQVMSGTATDVAGNAMSASVTVNLDKTPPALSITSPANGAIVTTSEITVTGSVSDSLSGVSTLTCNGVSAKVQAGAFSCPMTLAIGANTISVQAFDDAGNSSTQSENVALAPPPLITLVNPSMGQQGQQGLSVAITGQFTHFVPGTTQASFGAGITVASLTVSSATSLTAILSIDPTATVGTSNVTVTTGSEVVTLTNGFTVNPGTPGLIQVNPNNGQQGQQNLSVAITGQFTHFAQGTSTPNFGSGITVASLTVNSATSATAVLNIDSAAATGVRDVTLTTNAEVVTLANGFTVTAGNPVLTQVNPNAGQQGQQSLSVAITGQYTHFVQGTTAASFGVGITVASLTVNSATSATVVLNIDPAAATGVRTVTLMTGAEAVTLANGFTVTAGTSVLTQVNPNTGQQGQQSLSVAITGQYTHFLQGTTTASFGTGITVASLTVISATSATVVLNIDAAATTGARTITETTGAEVVTLANGFTVTPGTPVLTQLNPNTGHQGQQNLFVTITGQFTHFAQGATTANFGSGITVASLTVNAATSATALLNIDPAAPVGARSIILTTGTEADSLNNGFTVLAGQLTLSVQPPVSPTFQSSQVIAGSLANGIGQTAVTISGGASGVSQQLSTGQTQFGLSVPLRPNAENVLNVTATDASGQTASANNLQILQLTLMDLIKAQVTAQRLSTSEVNALVANGTINLSNPSNFNVSMFAVALTIGGHQASVSVPVISSVGDLFALGPPVTIGCQAPGKDIEQNGNTILVPCDNNGFPGPWNIGAPQIEVIPFELDVAGTGGAASVPGVLLIEGKIKTLKEFFKVNLLLMNVSSGFTLSNISAVLKVPDNGLSLVAPASGAIAMDDLAAGSQGTGQFVIRGDVIGVHTVTVNFGAVLGGPLLTTPIPISGSASTDVEVKGPPALNVTVEMPASVTTGVPYTLKVNIQNTSTDLDALYTSLELDLSGANLVDPTTGLPSTGPNIASLGTILAGQSVSQSFTVLPNDTGPITSCVGGATQNITLSVVFTNSGLGCAVGSLPSQVVSSSRQPTVAVVPAPNTVNVPVSATISAFFSDAIQTQTVTTGAPGATFLLTDPTGAVVPGQLQFATLPNGATAAVFRPASPLTPSSIYTVVLATSIFDVNGVQLASGITESFTTAPPPPTDTTPPQVTIQILPPANPVAVPQGQLLQVLVNSSDDSGVVARVDLLLDGQLVDTRIPQSPVTFLLDTSALTPGSSHLLTAVATDPSGNTAEASLNIAISADVTPPTVAISAATTVLGGQILPVSVSATDDTRVARVDLFLDSGAVPVYTGFIAPYQASLDTTSLANGPHQLRALATDGAGNVAQAASGFSVRSVTSIALSPGTVTLNGTGSTQSLTVVATLSDASTTPILSGVTFSSSNTNVAVVDPTGVVTSVLPGSATITATYGSLPPAQAMVADIAAVPATLALVSGDNQTGTVGQPLAAPLVVKVTDATNRPVPNVQVTFSVLAGGGTVAQSPVSTNTQGLASTTLTLGQTAGPNSVTATAGTLAGSPVTFHSTGMAPHQVPTLANPGNQTSVESANVSVLLVGSDPDGYPLTYSATGLPPPLAVNAATGAISGTLTATAGTYPVTVTVSDGSLSASQSFTWTVTAPQTPFVDLAVSMTASPSPDPAGVSLTYTVTVSNLGSAPATGVVVTDVLPAALVFLNASPSCANTGTVTCNLGTLAPTQSATITIVVAAFTAGQITNTATVSSGQVDAAPANNTATTVTTVVIAPLGTPGLSPTATSELFNPSGLNWSPAAAMSTPRAGTTLTVLADGTVLVLGGVNVSTGVFSPVASGELFSPATGAWTPTTSLNAPRAFHTTTLLPNGDVLITGGLDGKGNPVATSEVYRGPPLQKTTPILTWPAPAGITHATPLGTAQLNATANVPGTFTYSPPTGTLLAAGSQKLTVTFVPSDTVHYTTATATVTLTVTP
jgi:uncharacterized repeat protein (TIGR01451 family)